MFNFFKKDKPVPKAPECTCGAWPDPSWRNEDYVAKYERVKACPVHKGMGMMMVQVSKAPPSQIPVPQPLLEVEDIQLTPAEFIGRETRSARLHLLSCIEIIGSRNQLYRDIDAVIGALEEIIVKEGGRT